MCFLRARLDGVQEGSAWLRMLESKETLQRMRRLTHKGLPCGDTVFVKEIERRGKRKLPNRQKSRPYLLSSLSKWKILVKNSIERNN